MSELAFGDPSKPATPPPVVQPQAGTNEPPLVEVPEWAKGIEKELFNEPSVKLHKDMNSLVKSYVNAQKMIGADKVVIPTKNSTPEVWNDFYKKIGLPESFEKYTVNKAEKSKIDDVLFNSLKDKAYKAGVLPTQLEQLTGGLEEYLGNYEKATIQKLEDNRKAAQENIKKEFGEAYDTKMKLANNSMDLFGSEQLKQKIINSGLNLDPDFVKFFASVGEKLGEHQSLDGNTPKTPNESIEEVNALMADKSGPYWNAEHPAHYETVQRVQKSMQKIYG